MIRQQLNALADKSGQPVRGKFDDTCTGWRSLERGEVEAAGIDWAEVVKAHYQGLLNVAMEAPPHTVFFTPEETEKEREAFIAETEQMTSEEIAEELRSNGVDPEELVKRVKQVIEKYCAPTPKPTLLDVAVPAGPRKEDDAPI